MHNCLSNQTTPNNIKEITKKIFNFSKYTIFEEELTKIYKNRNLVFTVKDRIAYLIQTKSVIKYVS